MRPSSVGVRQVITHVLAIFGIRSKRSHAKGCGRHDERMFVCFLRREVSEG